MDKNTSYTFPDCHSYGLLMGCPWSKLDQRTSPLGIGPQDLLPPQVDVRTMIARWSPCPCIEGYRQLLFREAYFVGWVVNCIVGTKINYLLQLKKKTLEVSVWDYDRFSSNDFLGEVSLLFSLILLIFPFLR